MKKRIILLVLSFTLLFNVGVYAQAQPTITSGDNQLQYFFSQPNHKTNQELIKVVNSAKSSLDIAIYSLTKDDIVKAIVDAKDRGVNVRIITDNIQSKGKSEKTELAILSKDNIPIKINKHSGLMHIKMTIADKTIATTGSYNYSEGATFENDEILLIINNSKIAQDWDKQFESMWNDTKKFSSYNNIKNVSTANTPKSVTEKVVSTPTQQTDNSSQGLIKGNINSKGEKIYHLPGDPWYNRTKAEAWFKTETEAKAAGYRPVK